MYIVWIVTFVCKHADNLILKAISNGRKFVGKGFSQADTDEINGHLNLWLQDVAMCF